MEKTLVELFQDARNQFYNAYGKLYTPQEAAILTNEILEELKKEKI